MQAFHRRTSVRWLLPGWFALLVAGCSAPAAPSAEPSVLVATVTGAISPVTANYLADAIDLAERDGHRALVVRIDTPGGLDTSMRDIVQEFLAAEVPVVVYVSPDGARAASAGAIITFASHVAAMAPGTAIGAATPVDLEGGDVERKVVNDAAAFAESIAEVRDRDVDFAGDTVRRGRSASANEALTLGAVDLVSPSITHLLDRIDGREVTVGPDREATVLRTADTTTVAYDMGLLRRIQQSLADPNLVFLFMSIGTLAVVYELASPGIGAGGAVGAISILLALFGLSVLPVSALGLLLVLVAAALFVAEVLAPGIGVAAAGGTVALVLGGIYLLDDAPDLEVSAAVIAPVAVVVGAAVVIAGRLVLRTRGVPAPTGLDRLVGHVVTVTTASGVTGQGMAEGTFWTLRSASGPLEPGAPVRVVATDGLTLVVEADDPASEHSQRKEST